MTLAWGSDVPESLDRVPSNFFVTSQGGRSQNQTGPPLGGYNACRRQGPALGKERFAK